MSNHIPPTLLAATALLIAASGLQASTTIYAEDFSTSTPFVNAWQSHIGGWFGNILPFQTFAGQDVSITTGANPALSVTAQGQTRSGAVVLDPALFATTGAGEYTLTFDVTAFAVSGTSTATVTVWSGSGYLPGTANALLVENSVVGLIAEGAATVNQLASAAVTGVTSAQTVTFTYDGTSAVALFFGATRGSNEPVAPTLSYDNISVSQFSVLTPIPEPSVTVAVCLSVLGLAFLRRRSA